MVRRGGRTPVTASSSSSASSNRWARSRPSSVTDGDLTGAKSRNVNNDSAKSSPNIPRSRGSSPVYAKKPFANGKSNRGGTYWRSRGSLRNVSNSVDPKFSITNEDFPELPGARGAGGKHKEKKEKDTLVVTYGESPRPNSSGSFGESVSCTSTTDDSGMSSGSRGNTPQSDNQPTTIKKLEPMEKYQKHHDKRKLRSPNKEVAPRSPKEDFLKNGGSTRSTPSYRSTPKKKGGNPGSLTASPAFMKLSKTGQKIPERRGIPLNSRGPISPKNIGPSADKTASDDKSKSSSEESKSEESQQQSVVMSAEEIEKRLKNTPKIVLGENGEMTNIPGSMIDDAFGLAAMLPILNHVKQRGNKTLHAEPDSLPLSPEKQEQKVLTENVEMLAIGLDLNSLGVPTKNSDQRPYWPTFAGPYSLQQLTPTNMGVTFNQIPCVYYTAKTLSGSFDMNHKLPEKLGNHELLYIFYNLPREVWQLNAARELQHRGWRFNIREKMWIRKHTGEPDEFGYTASMWSSIGSAEPADKVIVGIFEVYEAEKARISNREMRFTRSDIELASWEQTELDPIQKTLVSMVPPEHLWGPKKPCEEKSKSQASTPQAPIGTKPSAFGASRFMNVLKELAADQNSLRSSNNSTPTSLTKASSAPNRRLLSFADSPDHSSQSMEHQVSGMNEDPLRQQMYTAFFQQMQQQLQQAQAQQGRGNYQSPTPFHL